MDLNLQERVIKEIDEKEIIELAKELIQIPSFTTQETECARFLATYMKENGLEVEIFEVEKGRDLIDLYNHLTIFQAEDDEKPCLYLTSWG